MKEKYYYKTPLGWIRIVASHLHVYEIKYIKKPIEYSFEKPNKLIEKVKENLNIYFLNPNQKFNFCLLYTSPSPRDLSTSRMPSSA